MMVWTPLAEAAAGGRAAMESLALASVANANLVYANSGVNAQLSLVYAAPCQLRRERRQHQYRPERHPQHRRRPHGSGPHAPHSVRRRRGDADWRRLSGLGLVRRRRPDEHRSTSFAPYAFSVVDRTCAVGNLSYAHEVGHNQGLNHDPANASGTAAYSYAYGYQSPSGLFRTLMAYGSATRIPFLSSPSLLTTACRPAPRARTTPARSRNTVATVAAFKATTSSAPRHRPAPIRCRRHRLPFRPQADPSPCR